MKQLKSYMCVVTTGEYRDLEIITATNYVDLIHKVIDNIMDTQSDDYPDLMQFTVPNSVDFIVDKDEEDYRYLLNEILYFLDKSGSDYSAKIYELGHEIENDLVNLSHDLV